MTAAPTPTPSSGLLPCPWCGHQPLPYPDDPELFRCWNPECAMCGAGPLIASAWNSRRAAGEMPDLTELMIALLAEARVGAALLELKATPTSTDQAKRIRAAIAAVESLYPRAGQEEK